jgi:hypothetical protein
MISTNQGLRFLVGSRSRRRMLVVGYGCFLAFLCFAFLRYQTRHGSEDMGLWFVFQLLAVLPGLLGGVRGGGLVKPFRGVHWVPMQEQGGVQTLLKPANGPAILQDISLDEREMHERDRVHFVAYTLARWFALLLFVIYGVLGALQVSWFGRVGPFFLFLLTVTLWSLPQSIILWTEPDMTEPEMEQQA